MSQRRAAFTLFELVLAIALSATLLVLIGTAINLYLGRLRCARLERLGGNDPICPGRQRHDRGIDRRRGPASTGG